MLRQQLDGIEVHFELEDLIFQFAGPQVEDGNFSLQSLHQFVGVSFLDFHYILIVHDVVPVIFVE